MTRKRLTDYFQGGLMLRQMTGWTGGLRDRIRSAARPYLLKIADSALFQFFVRNKNRISIGLYLLWTAGCAYWIYQLVIIDVKPQTAWNLGVSDSRDALVYLFFGLIGSIFLLFLLVFVTKLIYNLFHDGLESLFPSDVHSLVKPISYMLILMLISPFTGSIKAAGLTAYLQVIDIVHTSKNRDMVIKNEVSVEDLERKMNELLNMIEEKRQE